MVDLLGGLKLTGRIGSRLNIGLLDVQIAKQDEVRSRNLAVGRISWNLLEESSIGAIGTYGDPNSNRGSGLFGFDANYRTSQFLGDKAPDRAVLVPALRDARRRRSAERVRDAHRVPERPLVLVVASQQHPAQLRPGPRRVQRPGAKTAALDFHRRFRTNGWLRFVQTRVQSSVIADPSNEIETASVAWSLVELETRLGGTFAAEVIYFYDRVREAFDVVPGVALVPGEFEMWRGVVKFSTAQARALSGSLRVTFGDQYDGSKLVVVPTLLYRPSPHLRVSASYRFEDFDLPEGRFDVQIASLRVGIQPRPISRSRRSCSGTTSAVGSAPRCASRGSSSQATNSRSCSTRTSSRSTRRAASCSPERAAAARS